MRLQCSVFPFAGTQHFNNLSYILKIGDIAISLAAVTLKHTSAVEVDALRGANIQRKYTLGGMLKISFIFIICRCLTFISRFFQSKHNMGVHCLAVK